MTILAWVSGILLLLGVGGIGMTKLTRNKGAYEQAERLGYQNMFLPIGIVEVGAVIAVVLGLVVDELAWLGRAAAAGITAMMVVAFWYHQRAGDTFERLPSIVMTVLAVAYLIATNGA